MYVFLGGETTKMSCQATPVTKKMDTGLLVRTRKIRLSFKKGIHSHCYGNPGCHETLRNKSVVICVHCQNVFFFDKFFSHRGGMFFTWTLAIKALFRAGFPLVFEDIDKSGYVSEM